MSSEQTGERELGLTVRDTTDRRSAVLRLGTLGMAALTALGANQAVASIAAPSDAIDVSQDAKAGRRRGPRGHRGKKGPKGPQGPAGSDFTVVIVEETSEPFGADIADPNPITATADCGAAGLVVGGGFAVNIASTPEDFAANGTITESSADSTLRYFTVSLAAAGGPPNLVGTSVTAFAYCRVAA